MMIDDNSNDAKRRWFPVGLMALQRGTGELVYVVVVWADRDD